MFRSKVNKGASARSFSKKTQRTKAANISAGPMRGGWRL